MEDLTTTWNRLTLTNEEGPGCYLDEEFSSEEYLIASHFLTKRALNIDAIAKTITPLWRSRNGFKVRNVGNHKMLFVFDNKTDVDKVLMSEPRGVSTNTWWSCNDMTIPSQLTNCLSIRQPFSCKSMAYQFGILMLRQRKKFVGCWGRLYHQRTLLNVRERILSGLEYQWTFLVPCAEAALSLLGKKKKCG